MIRRALPALALVLTALVAVFASGSACSTRASTTPGLVWAPATLVFSGHGWGHGVGMSQYGALGYAQHGYSYERIVGHYFPGTNLGRAGSKTIRVLLAAGRSSLTLSSTAPFTVSDAGGTSHELGDLSVKLDSSLTVDTGSGSVSLTGTLMFSAGAAPLAFAGRSYRGKLEVEPVGKKLRLINYVGLEPYLYGVVPCESPHDWPAQALQAQAVVARTYALTSIRPSSDFDVYADTRSQVYHGRSGEFPESTAAVDATAAEVVYYDGELAHTFFFSTSGGRTAAIQDAWPKAQPLPYLVSVSDPYDSVSPFHNWGPVTASARALAKKLKIPGPVYDLTTTINGSERVATVTLTGGDDTTHLVSGDSLRSALDLRSTWFSAEVLALQHPAGALAYGTGVRVAGRVRGAESPTLEIRPSGGAWQTLARLAPGSDGLFKVMLRPSSTSDYRIADGSLGAAPVRVPVAAAVRLGRSPSGGVRGSFRPGSGSAAVVLQRLVAAGWKDVATVQPSSSGGFARAGALAAGQYRARVSGIAGLVPGYSPVISLG